MPRDRIVSIVDRDGRHLVRSHNNEQFAGKPLVPILIEHMRTGGTGTLPTTSLEGIPLISTVQYAPRSNWAAAAGLPEALLSAPVWKSMSYLLGTGILIAAAALLLAFLVAHRIDRAMNSLTMAAAAVGRGDMVDPLHSPVSEANVVADVLAHASRDLHALTASLETRVAARTAELSDANARLVAEMQRRRESEARVVQMQKIEAIGQLTGGIAHDFNNMLAIVLGSLRLLQRRLQRGETDVQKFIDGAIEGAERAASLTARLLAFSRQQPLAPEIIAANKLIAGMGEILRRTIPESVQIETVLAGGLWRTYADVQGLENAIINLAVNGRDAMAAMANGGKLTIETANAHFDEAYAAAHAEVKAGQYVMIAVTDTGVGMPQEIVGRAFDPFFTTKPAGSGTGLGLSQVHGFIKQSGGHVAIYSEESQGTTVKLYLPRLSGAASQATAERATPARISHAETGATILVVEDDPDVRKMTVDMLQDMGYATLEADGGAAALRELDVHPEVALLFTDVVMPGMNGRQLAEEALQKRPDLAVLFTTGYTRNAIVHHGILDSGVHVLTKPHTYETLADKVSDLLRSRSAARDDRA
ncbi:MAG: response regulator [Rhizobiales bacterium]|nr:response regulator [Hyphomicrobiales bacterium]